MLAPRPTKLRSQRDPLNLLEPRLVEYHATVVIPFDEGVVFIGLLNCAKVAGPLSEVAQPLDAISGIELLASGGGGRRAAAVWHDRSRGLRRGATAAVAGPSEV